MSEWCVCMCVCLMISANKVNSVLWETDKVVILLKESLGKNYRLMTLEFDLEEY